MREELIRKEFVLCPACEKYHEVRTYRKIGTMFYRGKQVSFEEICCYCQNKKEVFWEDNQTDGNMIRLRKAYEEKIV